MTGAYHPRPVSSGFSVEERNEAKATKRGRQVALGCGAEWSGTILKRWSQASPAAEVCGLKAKAQPACVRSRERQGTVFRCAFTRRLRALPR